MRVEQEMVQQFHDKVGAAVAPRPQNVDRDTAKLRYNLIREENEEYLEAADAGELTNVADALADLLYVVLGACVVHGIDIRPIFEEVHRSNMTKTPLDPVTKKGGKGPGYQPPRIAELLLKQWVGIE